MSGSIKIALATEQRNIRRLKEIHKLKQENRALSSRRSVLLCKTLTKGYYDSEYRFCVKDPEGLTQKELSYLCKISERIGSNGNKIQRLRTMIKQDKM